MSTDPVTDNVKLLTKERADHALDVLYGYVGGLNDLEPDLVAALRAIASGEAVVVPMKTLAELDEIAWNRRALASGAAQGCLGIPDPDCHYLATCGQPCNKCGKVHRHHLLLAPPLPTQPETAATLAADLASRQKSLGPEINDVLRRRGHELYEGKPAQKLRFDNEGWPEEPLEQVKHPAPPQQEKPK